jgi:hypothetical protein
MLAVTPLVFGYHGFDLGDMLAASGPGGFSAHIAGDWTTHIFSLVLL